MKRLAQFALAAAWLACAGCTDAPRNFAPRDESGQNARQAFAVRGFLRGINFAEKSVTVEHEEIPGYMPAMTMPFEVKTMSEVEPLKIGDPIGFTMVVTDKTSWIEGVKRIDGSQIQLPGKRSTLVKAAADAKVERVKEGEELPEFGLVDSKGRQLTRETFAGKPLLLTFIFTRCPVPNFCPLMSSNFRHIQEALAADPQLGSGVQYLSISFDPEFDTPEVLDRYGALQTQDQDTWRFATGSPEEVKRLTQAFSVYVQPESGTIAHGLATALIGPDGVIRKIWRGNSWEPKEVVAALHDLQTTQATDATRSASR